MWYIILVVLGLLFFIPQNPGISIMLLSMIFIGLSDPSSTKTIIRYNEITRRVRPILLVVIFVLYWISRISLLSFIGIPYVDIRYVDIAFMVLWAYMVIVEIIIFKKYKDL